MWPFRKTARQRRLETRKAARPEQPAWRRFVVAGGIGGVLMALLLYLAVLAMDLYPVQPFSYRLGQYLPQDVHARAAFRIPLGEEIERAKGAALRATPAVFQLDEALIEEIAAALKQLPRRAAATRPAAATPAKPPAAADPNEPAAWRAVADDPNRAAEYARKVDALVAELPQSRVVRLKDPETHKPQLRWPDKAVLRFPGGREDKAVADLLDVGDEPALAAEAARLADAFPPPLRRGVRDGLLAAMRTRPVYRYDRLATQERMDQAVAAVAADPPDSAYKEYAVGERIARRSRRTDARGKDVVVGLTAQELDVLLAEHETFRTVEAGDRWRFWPRIAGRAAIGLLAVVLLSLYVARYQPRLITDRLRAVGLLVVLVLALGLNKVLAGALRLNPYVSVLPVMLAGAVLSIAWEQRFALAAGATVAALVALQARAGIEPFLVLLAALAAGVFQLDEVRTRTKVIRVGAVAGLVVFLAVGVVGLAQAVPWRFALIDAAWAAGCAVLTGFVVQGILPLIERVFHVATSLTLLEWCDASRPLLKRLAMEAPGTYNHSLQLGALCEAAAEAIGAGGLLARVGAYYHDIGKIHKPDYFIENQSGTTGSKHDKLSPAMSLLIIVGHVKDGIEMAREYGLPKVLHEFIATHHGTTLVQYFYQAAAEQRKDNADRAPDEMEFRYPGPKPHSQEPAILMLADAAESSVRAMSEPTPGRIENQVHTMVTRRLMDGQLDECELTLKQVHQIESSVIKSLCSTYHARISYPTPAGEKPSASERHPRQPNGKSAPGRKPTARKPGSAPADQAPDPEQQRAGG